MKTSEKAKNNRLKGWQVSTGSQTFFMFGYFYYFSEVADG